MSDEVQRLGSARRTHSVIVKWGCLVKLQVYRQATLVSVWGSRVTIDVVLLRVTYLLFFLLILESIT